jgi:WD40 repeat protein
MTNKIFTPLFFMAFCFCSAQAQKEINNWCFPSNAGLDFNGGIPVFTNCNMSTSYQEGCSSISDLNGNLLFYTDGTVIRDKNHAIMPNGSGLLGSYTTSEGALIVQEPGSTNIFYVFTLDMQNGPNGLHYSIVDMSLQGGLGDVTVLNTQLSPGTTFTEKMIGIHHSNNNDVWLVVHESFTNAFYCYLITSSGVNPVPVVTNAGQVYVSNDDVGTMHCTLDGTRIAAAYWGGLTGYEIFDFDKSSGTLSNPLYLTDPSYSFAYSVCFSPDGRYLYGGCYNTNLLYQFDLQQAMPTGVLVANTPASVGDMQLGPDSNIYLVLTNLGYVSAIYDPDSAAPACNYVQNAINMNGMVCSIGITNYVYPPGNLQPVALFNAPNHICPGTCTSFNNISLHATSYLWTFAGANPAVSTDVNPTGICYNTPGTYPVSLIATNQNGSDTLTLNNFITVYPYPPAQGISQNGDTLFAIAGANSYQWYYAGNIISGASDYFYVASQSGNYNVVATDGNGCEVEAVIFDVFASVITPESGDGIFIFPNPVHEKLLVKFPQNQPASEPATITIYNMTGEKCMEAENFFSVMTRNSSDEISIDASRLAQGVHWLEIRLGKNIFRKRFIKN